VTGPDLAAAGAERLPGWVGLDGRRDDDQDPNVTDVIAPDEQAQSETLSFTADRQAQSETLSFTADRQAAVGDRTVVPPVASGALAVEDVDDDGSKTDDDVVALFEISDPPAVEASGAFEFDAIDRFEFNDVVRLFEELS
jgi:hypothetical protein